MVITETKTDLPVPEIVEPQQNPTANVQAKDTEGQSKCIRKPFQHVMDLLEGCGTWTDEPTNSLVPSGVQLMVEGGANDDELTDCLTIPDHVEGYMFVAVTEDSEALEL